MSFETAAGKILRGDFDPDELDAMIARCAWCQEPRSNYRCWHQSARILLANGLRPPADHEATEARLFPLSERH